MDDIQEIIHLMGERDRNNFVRFLNVEKEKDNRDDLHIFMELSGSGARTRKTAGAKKTQDAYHQNRKRLMEKLTDYYVLKSRKDDITGASKIMGLMTMSKFLFEGKHNRLGWKTIRKAEKLGWESEQYNLLNSIYLLMIEHADSFHATDIKSLIRSKTQAYKLAQQEENILVATQIIKQKLHEVKTRGTNLNFNVYLTSLLKKFNLTGATLENPRYLYNIIHAVRSSYLAARDLKHFEAFVLEQYHVIETRFGFKKQHHQLQIELLYMIAHVLYRNRKYTQSLEYLRLMYSAMNGHGKINYRAFYPKYVSLHASVKSFTGKNTEAIAMHEKLLYATQRQISIKDELNMYLNLAVFYNFNRQYAKSHAIFKSQKHRDEWLENKMGREFVLRKNMSYALNLYDMHQEDEGLEKLVQVQERYADLLGQPQYEKVKVYLELVTRYFENPGQVTQRQFLGAMSQSTRKFAIDDEENKTIAFFCWLLARVKQTDYYKLVLETVRS